MRTAADFSPGVASNVGEATFEMISLLTNYSLKAVKLFFNMGSLEKYASNYIFAKLQRSTCIIHCKLILVAVKHQNLYFLFTHIIITRQIIE